MNMDMFTSTLTYIVSFINLVAPPSAEEKELEEFLFGKDITSSSSYRATESDITVSEWCTFCHVFS